MKYKVQIDIPSVYIVDAKDKFEAEVKALKLWDEDIDEMINSETGFNFEPTVKAVKTT